MPRNTFFLFRNFCWVPSQFFVLAAKVCFAFPKPSAILSQLTQHYTFYSSLSSNWPNISFPSSFVSFPHFYHLHASIFLSSFSEIVPSFLSLFRSLRSFFLLSPPHQHFHILRALSLFPILPRCGRPISMAPARSPRREKNRERCRFSTFSGRTIPRVLPSRTSVRCLSPPPRVTPDLTTKDENAPPNHGGEGRRRSRV